MSAKTAWRETRHRQTPGKVGEFFNYMAATTLGGIVTGTVHDGSTPEFGDVCVPEAGLCVEVKGSGGGGHHWRLHHSQQGAYADAKPLISYAYFLGGYQNRAWRKPGEKSPRGIKSKSYSALARCHSKSEMMSILAESTDRAYLFDIDFVETLQCAKVGGVVEDGFGDGRSVYQLKRRELYFLHEATRSSVEEKGINSAEWVFRTLSLEHRFSVGENWTDISDKVYPVEVKYKLHTALSPEMDEKLYSQIVSNDHSDLPF